MAAVDAAITSRHSMRAFLPTEVPRETIEEILQIAARAPSGTNTQPWQVHVLTGQAKQRLSDRIIKAHADPVEAASHREEYAYYPSQWVSPYIDRRRKVGWDLYGLLGLGKTDKEGMHKQHARNGPRAAYRPFATRRRNALGDYVRGAGRAWPHSAYARSRTVGRRPQGYISSHVGYCYRRLRQPLSYSTFRR